MIVTVYGFHDDKASAFIGDHAALVLLKHDAVALRQFGDLCRAEGSIFAKHPDDYSLVSIGEFDTETGKLEGWVGGPRTLATAAQVLEAK